MNQSVNQIDVRLQEIARDVFGDDSLVLTDSTKAAKVSGWDSFARVNFILSVETEFDVEFSEEDIVGFDDIGGLKRILTERIANPSVVGATRHDGGRAATDCVRNSSRRVING